MPRDQWRRVRGEQEIIVRYAPDEALASLPQLLRNDDDRARLVTLVRAVARRRARAAREAVERAARDDRAHRRDAVGGARGAPRARKPARKPARKARASRLPRARRLIMTMERPACEVPAAARLLQGAAAHAPPPSRIRATRARCAARSTRRGSGLIAPILVGPKARIEAVAKQFGIDLGKLPIVDAPYSEASAAKAVDLVREGKAEALMKGSLHTDELMGAVVRREAGLRTARRISHCFVMDVPSYPETLIVTDAAINIAPTMEDKVDIIQNAIDLAHALRFPEVRVAILSAMETVNPKVPSTVEAGALCKMADRGQITGAIIDGPLALDNAISLESVKIKKIDSPVAGRANVLIVPDLEAGNMLAKSLSFLAGADAAASCSARGYRSSSPAAPIR